MNPGGGQLSRPASLAAAKWSSLDSLFTASAERCAEEVALISRSGTISYRQLADQRSRIASMLGEASIGRDGVVGVLMERSCLQVAALLGILHVGAAFVPLDPTAPETRLRSVLDTAGITDVVCTESLAGLVGSTKPDVTSHVVADAPVGAELRDAKDEGSIPKASAEDIACILFTSGTTGVPKGVELAHAGLHNRLAWMQETYGLIGQERVLYKTPLTFDVSLWEVFWPLTCGADMVVSGPQDHANPEKLVQIISDFRVNIVHFVPTMLRAFLRADGVRRCPSLRLVISSGESLEREDIETFVAEASNCRLDNLYGPTEASIDVTQWECSLRTDGIVPIGKSISNMGVWICDDELRPVSLGEPGEIVIGGIGVALGYRGDSKLTEQQFPENNIAPELSARVYRTGDRGRVLKDGNIAYLGRLDRQVKIRGQRIELDEIEGRLRSHKKVAEAAVVTAKGSSGSIIVAFVVGDLDMSATELRRYLLQYLPSGHVPARIELLDELPVTRGSGKIDRQLLTARLDQRPELDVPFVAPESPLEVLIAGIWRDVLEMEEVGIDDDFFDLGGDSLTAVELATQLVEDIETAFGVELDPEITLIEFSTVRSLSGHVTELLELQSA